MEQIKETDYKRPITHTKYRNTKKKGGWGGILHHKITDNTMVLDKKWLTSGKNFLHANDIYLELYEAVHLTPLWGGGVFLILTLICIYGFFKFPEERSTTFFITVSLISIIGFLFFLIYYYTMPKKEVIYNRKDGLVTYPGFMWHPNVTMPVDVVRFIVSSPTIQGGNAFQLNIMRPDKLYSRCEAFFAYDCYKDLSFLLWYMDKNRPLPPGDAFDPYRERDYERRKAAGFPKPLFPCDFDTKEATEAQQKERERIGGW